MECYWHLVSVHLKDESAILFQYLGRAPSLQDLRGETRIRSKSNHDQKKRVEHEELKLEGALNFH